MRAPRVDQNHASLASFARSLGALVETIPGSASSPGRPDVLWLFRSRMGLAEVKRAPTGKRGGGAGHLEPDQLEWHAEARRRGVTVDVWRTREDVLRSLGLRSSECRQGHLE